MTGWGDEVEEDMDTIVTESGVSLDAGLGGENVIVLMFKVADNLAEAGFVVNLITEARGVDDGQRDAGSFIIDFELYCRWSDEVTWQGATTAFILRDVPTVTGLILIPSSRWALAASSSSLGSRTRRPQRVLTNVVRPGKSRSICGHERVDWSDDGLDGGRFIPVPDAPTTIKTN